MIRLRPLTRRERLLGRIFLLVLTVSLCAAIFAAQKEQLQALELQIEKQENLIRKEKQTKRSSPEELARELAELKARLSSRRETELLDQYAFGDALLTGLQKQGLGVERYRPEPDGSFFFAGSASPPDLIRFLKAVSGEHPEWKLTALMVSRPEEAARLRYSFTVLQAGQARAVPEKPGRRQ